MVPRPSRLTSRIGMSSLSARSTMQSLAVNVKPGVDVPHGAMPLLQQMFFRLAPAVDVEKATPRADGTLMVKVKCSLYKEVRGRRRAEVLVKVGGAEAMISERDAYNDSMEWVKGAEMPTIITTAVQGDQGAIPTMFGPGKSRQGLIGLGPAVLTPRPVGQDRCFYFFFMT